jgi:hypothetical protein
MLEPGLDRHDWESEWQGLEPLLHDSPAEALPEADALISRILEERGYSLDDPVAREGDEREVVAEFQAAHDIAVLVERGETENVSPGDIAAAVNGYRALFDHLVSERSAP